MARRRSKRSLVYLVSIGAHLAIGGALALVPREVLHEVVAIALSETTPEKKPEPPKPAEHREAKSANSPGRNVRPVRAVAPEAIPQNDAPAFTDIGLALDSAAEGGLAVNIAPSKPIAPLQAPPPALPKVLVVRRTEPECEEPVIKARPLGVPRPSYTDEAVAARVEGRVRVELTVAPTGEVVGNKVLKGLGYGLDEAALAAAKTVRFSPATKCGKPVTASFVIAMRFVLST